MLLFTFSTKWGVVISVEITPGKTIVILISGLSSTLSVSKNLTKAALLAYNGNQVKSIVIVILVSSFLFLRIVKIFVCCHIVRKTYWIDARQWQGYICCTRSNHNDLSFALSKMRNGKISDVCWTPKVNILNAQRKRLGSQYKAWLLIFDCFTLCIIKYY